MIPVNQTKLYQANSGHHGNCRAACLASLLELELFMVPPFEDMPAFYSSQDLWLKRIFNLELVERRGDYDMSVLPEFYIANGLSSRNVLHSVIYSNGVLIHDPHPSKEGILSVEWVNYLRPIAK